MSYLSLSNEEILFVMKAVAQVPIGETVSNNMIKLTRHSETNFDIVITDDRFTKTLEVESELFG